MSIDLQTKNLLSIAADLGVNLAQQESQLPSDQSIKSISQDIFKTYADFYGQRETNHLSDKKFVETVSGATNALFSNELFGTHHVALLDKVKDKFLNILKKYQTQEDALNQSIFGRFKLTINQSIQKITNWYQNHGFKTDKEYFAGEESKFKTICSLDWAAFQREIEGLSDQDDKEILQKLIGGEIDPESIPIKIYDNLFKSAVWHSRINVTNFLLSLSRFTNKISNEKLNEWFSYACGHSKLDALESFQKNKIPLNDCVIEDAIRIAVQKSIYGDKDGRTLSWLKKNYPDYEEYIKIEEQNEMRHMYSKLPY